MASASPKVSVVLAACNAATYVEAAVKSILDQTFRDFELIFLDDASSDGTPDLVERLEDERITVVRGRQNVGQTELLNAGLARARGEYVARMDADDVCDPERFARQVRYLDLRAHIAAVASNALLIDEAGTPLGHTTTPVSPGVLSWELSWRCPIIHPSVMFRRSFVVSLGGFDPQYLAQDYDLWVRILHNGGRISVLPEPLLHYRQSSGQVTAVYRERLLRETSRIALQHIEWLLTSKINPSLVQGMIHLYLGDSLVDDPGRADYLRLADTLVEVCSQLHPSEAGHIQNCAADALVFAAIEARKNGNSDQALSNVVRAIRSRPIRTVRPRVLHLLANVLISRPSHSQ